MVDLSSGSEQQDAFGKRYVVDVSKPLPEFNSAGGSAYMVTDNDNPSLSLYAFVQNPKVPVRFQEMKELKDNKVKGLICPLDYGVMSLNLGGILQRFVIIFDRPSGGALFVGKRINTRLTVALQREAVPLAFVSTLALLHNRKINHRHIHPGKLFFVTDDSDDIVLGECITAPSGMGLPIDLEPMELMFADSASRGDATPAADMYQMGAAILTYLKNKPIWENRQRAVSLKTRIQHGSFVSMSRGGNMSGALGNLVKGLMDDEIENRFGIGDVLNWFEGGKKRKVPSIHHWNLNRPTLFNGEVYSDRRLLADGFATHPKEAVEFLQSLDFGQWIADAIRTEVMEERVETLIGAKQSESISSSLEKKDYSMLSRICIHLHPGGPVRYMGMSMQIDSLSSTLAAVLTSGSKDHYAGLKEVINDKFLTILAEIVGERDMDFFNHVGMAKKSTGTAQSVTLGRGLERVLYNLNRELPCLSERFDKLWINDAGKFAMALNSADNRDILKATIFDRHVAAYLASRDEAYARMINSFSTTEKDPSRFAILALEFFGGLQNKYELPNMSHLTGMLIEGLRATVHELKNKKRKAKVQAMLEKMKQGGDITHLTSKIDIGQIQTLDKQGFARARAAIFGLERQRVHFSHKYTATDLHCKATGYRWVRSITVLVFIATVIVTLA